MQCEVCQEHEADVCNTCLHEITSGMVGPQEERSGKWAGGVNEAVELLTAGKYDEARELLMELLA